MRNRPSRPDVLPPAAIGWSHTGARNREGKSSCAAHDKVVPEIKSLPVRRHLTLP